jgi:PII-like signaling protein
VAAVCHHPTLTADLPRGLLSEDLPMVTVAVDTRQRIEPALA